MFTSLFSLFTSPVSITGSYTEVEPFFRRVKQEQFTSLFSLFTSPVSITGSYTEVEPFFRRVKQEQKKASGYAG